jgi:DNA/RNA endonuclease G (NUC1)
MKNILKLLILILWLPLCGQSSSVGNDTNRESNFKLRHISTDIFEVIYSEKYEQPTWLRYKVQCPLGNASRRGLDFYQVDSVRTSDNYDYSGNVWDKGHLAPASAFNCDRETLKKTFTYLNCVLQHEGLNRGPWKELERFEVGLSKIYDEVFVEIKVCFEGELIIVPGGATVPSGFIRTIKFDNKEIKYYFPNIDVSGKDWGLFRITNEQELTLNKHNTDK